MSALALASLRSRAGSFVACALSIFLGAALMAGFTSLVETSAGTEVSDGDAETLIVMGTVVGGWGVIIVLFAVASTVSITVRQRHDEITMLRAIGATRRQVRSLVRRETMLVALLSAMAGLVPGWLLGRALLALIGDAGLVSDGITHIFGITTAGILTGTLVVVAACAATLAVRRVARPEAQSALAGAAPERLSAGRIALGIGLVLVAASQGAVALVVASDSDDPFLAMQIVGSASIFASMGLALLSPPVIRFVAVVMRSSRGLTGAPAHLAGTALSRRSVRASGLLIPVIVFVGIALGTLLLMAMHNTTVMDQSLETESATVELLNYVVVAMIALFAAIMIVTTGVAATLDRRGELARLRLAGATRREAVGTVIAEGAVLTIVGIVLGAVGSLFTIVPFAVVRTEAEIPVIAGWLLLGVVLVAITVTMATLWGAARRAVADPPVAVLAA